MPFKKGSSNDIKFEVVENYGKLTEDNNAKELRLVSWNGREAKYDLRSWSKKEDGTEVAGKGITLTGEECEELLKLLQKIAE